MKMEVPTPRPTIINAYGGFMVSLTPGYSAIFGKGWLEQGGVYVEANIRGGGEYGPEWHKAALLEKRQNALTISQPSPKTSLAVRSPSPVNWALWVAAMGVYWYRLLQYKGRICLRPFFAKCR